YIFDILFFDAVDDSGQVLLARFIIVQAVDCNLFEMVSVGKVADGFMGNINTVTGCIRRHLFEFLIDIDEVGSQCFIVFFISRRFVRVQFDQFVFDLFSHRLGEDRVQPDVGVGGAVVVAFVLMFLMLIVFVVMGHQVIFFNNICSRQKFTVAA